MKFASVLRGLVQSDLYVYCYLSCVVMDKYTLYTHTLDTGVHWVDLAVPPPVLLVKASLMQNLLTFLTQRAS